MSIDNLEEILDLHKKWLIGEDGGRRADLCGADLRDADLCGADLRDASLRRANLCGANLRRANLCRADLCGADLRDADLCVANLCDANLFGADLRRANLCDAHLWDCTGNRKELISLFLFDEYTVVYSSEYLQIGCERHKIEDWRDFDDQRIIEMNGKTALKFWRENKELIFTIIEKHPAKQTKED